METLFYISSFVAVIATFLVMVKTNVVHALLYLVVSLLAVALVFFVLGAPFIAALEIIIYAGAIMVLFVFVVMMLNLGSADTQRESEWLTAETWAGPVILAAVLLGEVIFILVHKPGAAFQAEMLGPRQVGISLLGPYLLGAELASILLLAGLAGAYHIGRHSGEKGGGGRKRS
ncbi:MAG: NADH-quinone oxidoreductase subunit J [Candidatus Sulfobium sp.]